MSKLSVWEGIRPEQVAASWNALCSNLSESPEKWGRTLALKYGYLQELYKFRKPLANYLTAIARWRAGIRIPSAPLHKPADLIH
jgi:hypothetical protein